MQTPEPHAALALNREWAMEQAEFYCPDPNTDWQKSGYTPDALWRLGYQLRAYEAEIDRLREALAFYVERDQSRGR